LDSNPIGVVVGLRAEARIARRLGWPVAVGGGTPGGADRAARALIADGARALVSFGLAGGLSSALRPGDVLVPEAVLVEGVQVSCDTALAAQLGGMTPHRLLAGIAIAATAVDKDRLWRTTGAHAIDLESGAVARVAMAEKLPFAVLRAICDPAERNLPPAARLALDQAGVIGVWRVLFATVRQPGQIFGLLALAADAAAARRALHQRVAHIRHATPRLR
jgi:adenosylhomocysteine nucleosidase